MGKICPEICSISSEYISDSRETFTIWMKSLVFNGKGCTAFNSKGEIIFRIDNYQQKCSTQVNLMDSKGQALFSIQRKRLPFWGHWNIFKWSETNLGNKEGQWFRIRKRYFNLGRSNGTACTISICFHKSQRRRCYKIIKINKKSAFKIIDSADHLVAEVEKKQTSSGFDLGDDVLSLVVEPEKDFSLVMALVTVYMLINGKM